MFWLFSYTSQQLWCQFEKLTEVKQYSKPKYILICYARELYYNLVYKRLISPLNFLQLMRVHSLLQRERVTASIKLNGQKKPFIKYLSYTEMKKTQTTNLSNFKFHKANLLQHTAQSTSIYSLQKCSSIHCFLLPHITVPLCYHVTSIEYEL